MGNLIHIHKKPSELQMLDHLLAKCRFASGLSDIMATYSGSLRALIKNETCPIAKGHLQEIQDTLIGMVDGPIMRLFSVYDDNAGGITDGKPL